MIESETNQFRSPQEEVINSPWAFEERFMDEAVLPCNATIHPEATGSEVKGKVSKDQIQ